MTSKKDTDNKDYILNIRVSKKTYENVKKKARENGESASNLVRKVLRDGEEILGNLSNDIFGSPEKNIEVYYSGSPAKDTTCIKCKKKIKANTKVTVGETSIGRKHYFCSKCKK